ncbi:MAG: NAD(P)/FAD-dependent oxidoreductase [Hyphomicrobiales bacterium]|nr:NAD(P)/FAD-dependent oxidoreductase [Hyphomicrobiales bacterium]
MKAPADYVKEVLAMAEYEVAIIGGGPAGLAAALTLSRSMMRTIIFDSPLPPRNDASPHIGAYPGMDMATPKAVRETISDQIGNYGYADIKSAEIASISGDDKEGFRLATQGGSSFGAKRVLLTTGMVDVFPMIAGIKDRWGTSVINSPFCQGYELRNRPWGIYVNRPELLAAAEVYRNWSRDLVMIVEPSIKVPEDRAKAIKSLGIEFVTGTAESLQGSGSALSEIVLRDGRRISREVLLIWPRQIQGELVKKLGLELCDDGYVNIDASYRTGRSGIYAAGDLTYGGHQNTNTAMHMGNMAAAWMVFDLCHNAGAQTADDQDNVARLIPSDLAETVSAPGYRPAEQDERYPQPKTA